MESVEARGPTTPMILGIVGGVAMAIGSFLTWATVSVDFDKIATAVGIDPSQIPEEIRAQGTVSATGWKAGDGKWTLVAGIVVVVAAALLAVASSRRVVGIVMVVGGVVGGGLALYDATIQKNDAVDNAAATFSGLGLPGTLRDYFSLSLGIGIWLCIAGGAIAIVSGVLAMTSQGPSIPATVGTSTGFTPPPPPEAGFGIAGVGGSLVPPVAAVPVAEAVPEPEPVAPSAEPNEGSGTGVPSGGEDPPLSP
jgi:hypothetical protein